MKKIMTQDQGIHTHIFNLGILELAIIWMSPNTLGKSSSMHDLKFFKLKNKMVNGSTAQFFYFLFFGNYILTFCLSDLMIPASLIPGRDRQEKSPAISWISTFQISFERKSCSFGCLPLVIQVGHFRHFHISIGQLSDASYSWFPNRLSLCLSIPEEFFSLILAIFLCCLLAFNWPH